MFIEGEIMVTTRMVPGGPSKDTAPKAEASPATEPTSRAAETHTALAAASFDPSLSEYVFTQTAQLPPITSEEMRKKFALAPIYIGRTKMNVEIS